MSNLSRSPDLSFLGSALRVCARAVLAAVLLAPLPGVAAAQTLPDALDAIAQSRLAILEFDTVGATLFNTMPAPADSIWTEVSPVLLPLETGPDPWFWVGSAQSVGTSGALIKSPALLDCARNSVAAIRQAAPNDMILDSAGDADVITYCSITLPVKTAPIAAELDRIAAALGPDFASVKVLRLGSAETGLVLIAEGGHRGETAIIDSVVIGLAPRDTTPEAPMMLSLRLTALLFLPGS